MGAVENGSKGATIRSRRFATALAYSSAQDMLFGVAPHPVRCGHGVIIGGGEVLPEVNFTLPSILIQESNFAEVRSLFRDMVTRILQRALTLEQSALVLEFEHLYELTQRPEWGATVTADIREILDDFYERHGLRTALRVTVADIREHEHPPRMRSGSQFELMMRAFEECAKAGADILSIESTGGKELFDQALLLGDVEAIVYAMGLLACRDMEFLWGHIVDIAQRYGCVPGGDTDCAHANTAMHLAHQRLIPKVLAAVVRLLAGVRSIVACEMGATGPLKDCGYENPIVKAVTGVPISMEGKTSACAHSSPVGNIAAAFCDLWSNESVQHVRLLSGFAPEVFAEMLIYDCRLMNTASQTGQGARLRDLFMQSDRSRDPHGWVMDLDPTFNTARLIIESSLEANLRLGETDHRRSLAVARYACGRLQDGVRDGVLMLSPIEQGWLERIVKTIDSLAEQPEVLRSRVEPNYPHTFLPEEYGLEKLD